MKGIILAGGAGTRLHPLTKVTSKQLLPVYNKPMIYYPLSVLMLIGIKDVLIITTPENNKDFKNLLGNGSQYKINIEYAIQEKPTGLPDAFIIGEEFLDGDDVCLILGDNLLFGHGLPEKLKEAKPNTIFSYQVSDPERYGVVELDNNNQIVSIEEKPKKPKSSNAIIGLYIFDNKAPEIAKKLKPSERGETEIIAMMHHYQLPSNGTLNHIELGRGFAWLDTGTYESLLDAGNFVRTLEKRQGLKIADLDEISEELC